MYVCLCMAVRDRDILDAVTEGARTLDEVVRLTGAGTVCGVCQPTVEALVESFEPVTSRRERSEGEGKRAGGGGSERPSHP